MKRLVGIMASCLTFGLAQADGIECNKSSNNRYVRCGQAVFQPDTPREVMESIARRYPVSKTLAGDLRGGEANVYVAYVTERTAEGQNDRIIVLSAAADGRLEQVAESGKIEYGTGDIEIKKHSIFVHIFHNSLDDGYSERYQFRSSGNRFVLIGAEISGARLDSEDSFTTSVNYLTHEIVETRIVGGKTTEIKSKLEGKQKVLQFVKQITLEEFVR